MLFVSDTVLQSGLISIILPAYNTQEVFLREAVESVLTQTYSAWELLVIDDSTTAPVGKIIESYQDERIKYFRNPQNLGMAASRNRGLELAAGEFIALLDHDDLWMPEKLEMQLELIRSANCNMVYSPVIFFGSDNSNSPFRHNISFADMLPRHDIISCSCVLIRTDLIKKFNLKFSPEAVPTDDYAMWINIALYGGVIECTEQYLVRYRKHNNNVSGTPLACDYPYEWILKDITEKLLKTKHSLSYKIRCLVIILRTRAWVLRKIISQDSSIPRKKKIEICLKAIQLCPIHPQGWMMLGKLLLGRKYE